jgi:hypothetical protein
VKRAAHKSEPLQRQYCLQLVVQLQTQREGSGIKRGDTRRRNTKGRTREKKKEEEESREQIRMEKGGRTI